MNTDTLDIVREIVHTGSAVLLIVTAAVAVAGFLKPRLLRAVFKEFAHRRYILGTAVFACLLCGTIFTATQPTAEPLQSNAPQPAIDSAETLAEPDEQYVSESAPQPAEPQGTSPTKTNSSARSAPASPQQSSRASAPSSPSTHSQPAPDTSVSSIPAQPPAVSSPSSEPKDCKVVQLLFVCI